MATFCTVFFACRHYGRGRLAILRPPPATSPATASRRQFGADGVPRGIDGRDRRANRGFIRPIVRIQTPDAFRQPVALFGRPPSPGDALNELTVAPPEPCAFRCAEYPPQQ